VKPNCPAADYSRYEGMSLLSGSLVLFGRLSADNTQLRASSWY
jgi:hypothetical protein